MNSIEIQLLEKIIVLDYEKEPGVGIHLIFFVSSAYEHGLRNNSSCKQSSRAMCVYQNDMNTFLRMFI